MTSLSKAKQAHISRFGFGPIIIGLVANEKLIEEIYKAIKSNTPYDEYYTVTKQSQKRIYNKEDRAYIVM